MKIIKAFPLTGRSRLVNSNPNFITEYNITNDLNYVDHYFSVIYNFKILNTLHVKDFCDCNKLAIFNEYYDKFLAKQKMLRLLFKNASLNKSQTWVCSINNYPDLASLNTDLIVNISENEFFDRVKKFFSNNIEELYYGNVCKDNLFFAKPITEIFCKLTKEFFKIEYEWNSSEFSYYLDQKILNFDKCKNQIFVGRDKFLSDLAPELFNFIK